MNIKNIIHQISAIVPGLVRRRTFVILKDSSILVMVNGSGRAARPGPEAETLQRGGHNEEIYKTIGRTYSGRTGAVDGLFREGSGRERAGGTIFWRTDKGRSAAG